jgi:peptidoglycan/xylan/chitin deacetylase (PgdA/CDA1 family)
MRPAMRTMVMAAAAALVIWAGHAKAESKLGDTTILKWKEGKKAVFLLAFDDSCQSHVKTVVPELQKRGMVGTFYTTPGSGQYALQRTTWEKELPKNPAVVYGNHTFSHRGVTTTEQLDSDLAKANDVIHACYRDRKPPWLISFGRPGGVPWKVTAEEEDAALAKHRLIRRPPFLTYGIHVKTAKDVCALVDAAIAKGDMGHLDFHGVGAEWLVTPVPVFIELLDKLAACRKDVWMTDHVTYHKYLTERSTAVAKVVEAGKDQIRVELSSSADSALYDAALTLETRVPADWKACRVEQGATRSERPVADGAVRYEGVPGRGVIVIRRR